MAEPGGIEIECIMAEAVMYHMCCYDKYQLFSLYFFIQKEGEPSLSSPDQHNLLTDVHLPDGSNFIPPEVDKGKSL